MLVGFVGSISGSKGAFSFARAADQALQRSSLLRFLWVGEEAGHRQLEALLAAGSRSRHALLPWTAAPERLYPALDLLAVPSEWAEPFGRVSVEAQACGVPVLASDVGGLPETLAPGESGELVPPGDSEAWTEALLRWADLPAERRASMGAAGRELVLARFATGVIARQFESLLSARPAPGR